MDFVTSFQPENFKHVEDRLREKEDEVYFGSCLRLFEEEILCDVTLVVGDQKQKIQAHKFILIARSEVFCAMLSGKFSETNGEIEIPDIEPDIMDIILRYMYTGDFEDPTKENVFSLLYAGEKYQLCSFIDRCEIFLQENICLNNYCIILNHATLYNKKNLLKECQLYAARWGKNIVASEDFHSLTNESLLAFVNSDYSNIKEEELFKACIKWAKNQCEKKKKKITTRNIRQTLGKILQSIRFMSMKIDTFTSDVSKENILTDGEKVALFQSIVNGSDEYMNFNFTSAPSRHTTQSLVKCVSETTISCPTRSNDRNPQECIVVNFDKDVHLVGVYVLKPESGIRRYDGGIQLTIKEVGTGTLHESECNATDTSFYGDTVAFVCTQSFVRLTANTKYALIIDFEGNEMTLKKGFGKHNCFKYSDLKLKMNLQKVEQFHGSQMLTYWQYKNTPSYFYGVEIVID